MKARGCPMERNVYWTLPAHDRPERPGERSGEIPKCARATRGQPDRRAPGSVPQRVPVHGVGAWRRRAQRSVAVRRAAASRRPALDLAREGSRARRRGTHSASVRQPGAGGARERCHARRPGARFLRDLGPQAVRGVRAVARRRAGLGLHLALAGGSEVVHVPVLVDEVAFLLRPRGEGWVIDGTVGMGGHAEALLMTSPASVPSITRSEEHTSELQSQSNLVCRLLLEKKKTNDAEMNALLGDAVVIE